MASNAITLLFQVGKVSTGLPVSTKLSLMNWIFHVLSFQHSACVSTSLFRSSCAPNASFYWTSRGSALMQNAHIKAPCLRPGVERSTNMSCSSRILRMNLASLKLSSPHPGWSLIAQFLFLKHPSLTCSARTQNVQRAGEIAQHPREPKGICETTSRRATPATAQRQLHPCWRVQHRIYKWRTLAKSEETSE